jgi:hypothetical protein
MTTAPRGATRAISKRRFWQAVNVLPPLLRLGHPDGPGGFILSEPWNLRRCTVTGKMDNTYSVYLVNKRADGTSRYLEHREPLTLHEFKALCDSLMPSVGVCHFGWGAELLDADGNIRTDLQFPIRLYR